MGSFHSLYDQGFARVCVATPTVALADPAKNAREIVRAIEEAHARDAALVLFPELGLSGYSLDDLLHQSALLDAVERALGEIVAATAGKLPLALVGAPLRRDGALHNCAIAVHGGRALGVVPKSFLPNYREFYEGRHFSPADGLPADATIRVAGEDVPFGADLLFEAADLPAFRLHVEICEDFWVPIPPSSRAALAGATVLANLSASNVTVGKAAWRRTLAAAQSGRCVAAYLYSAAGWGESTTDLAWDGQGLVCENGVELAEGPRFATEASAIFADVDLERLEQERMRLTTFRDQARREAPSSRRVRFALGAPRDRAVPLERAAPRFPYVPDDDARLAELCYEAFNIQATGLRQRIATSGAKGVVIGVSGGLDSAHALLVCATAFDALGLPRSAIHAYTLPAFATSERTKATAWALMRALGVDAAEIDVTEACRRMLADIGHPAARGEAVHDVTFENVQAGARTSLLFRLANAKGALVVGTGDLSELALGWCTYGVGDQMAHYNVNSSVPKTLIQHLIRWVAAEGRFGEAAARALDEVLATEISPELVPVAPGEKPQSTEAIVGPYALQDFTLFHATRYGFGPRKIAFLALAAWGDATRGRWPPNMTDDARALAYGLPEIKRWLGVFAKRFYQASQFKRSAMPNGPKVSSGGSLSPRGDWRAPSDSSAAPWLEELARVPDA
ncbi:MAG: NAD(+) synthase [Hyphomicrobiales bacterium]|nr:NAD(+) synthase [Hyphomicrobiales bacterium]